MGHFVRTEVAARIRFDVEMDAGEDFKYYLELWRQARARKIESVLFVNRRGAHSVGPKSADGSQWRAATTRVLGDFCTRQGVSVSFPWEGRLVRFAVGNPMDLIHRHFIAGTFFEAEELRYLRTIVPPNATILEVGANVGNHLIYYALFMRAARIVPIEPNPAAVALLIKNLRLNQIRNVDISLLGFGIGAERGRFDLSIADGGNIGAARLLASEGGTVEVYPLDEKFDGRADFIKVDVEWMEMEALAGMEAIIARSRPILFIEIMNENIAAFEAWAEARDYRIIKIFANVNAKNFVAVGAEHPLAAGGA
jgi:FkbM family methyltransferase